MDLTILIMSSVCLCFPSYTLIKENISDRKVMNIISNQYLRDEKKGSAVYTIEIRNFLRKLSQCRVGSKVSTEMFYVNLSKFSIDLYIAGDDG